MSDAPTPNTDRRGTVAAATGLDLAAVLLFAATGRNSHDEGITLAGVATTAWPFLVGTALGWLLARAWRRPTALMPTGVVIWISTVVVGIALRLASGQSTELKPSFLVVASVSTAVLLLGWRAGAVALNRRR
ncbi:MAG: DUF3054 domain-containing protein [Mycolicibacterium insubricum]|nr:DUF3054 domain-containing protein [Mycobacterium sp.]